MKSIGKLALRYATADEVGGATEEGVDRCAVCGSRFVAVRFCGNVIVGCRHCKTYFDAGEAVHG